MSRAPPSWSSASAASRADAGESMTIRFGSAAQRAGSTRAAARLSSQPASARIAAGAMISVAGEAAKVAARPRQFLDARDLGPRAAASPEEEYPPIRGAPRRQGRAADEAQPENDRIAVRPPRESRRAPQADRRGEFRIGASDIALGNPRNDRDYGATPRSPARPIADRRLPAAIVVPVFDASPDGRPVISPSLIVAAFLGFLLSSFSSSAAARPRSLPPCWSSAGGSSRSPCFISRPLDSWDALAWRELFPAKGRSEERPSPDGPGAEERPSLVHEERSEERPSPDGSCRPGVPAFVWMRWIRKSVSSLLPVAGVGGDAVAARLVHQRGVPGPQAAAGMVVDITIGAGDAGRLRHRRGDPARHRSERPRQRRNGVGAPRGRGFVRRRDRRLRARPAQQHVRPVRRGRPPARAEDLAVQLRRARRGRRRGRGRHIPAPLRPCRARSCFASPAWSSARARSG